MIELKRSQGWRGLVGESHVANPSLSCCTVPPYGKGRLVGLMWISTQGRGSGCCCLRQVLDRSSQSGLQQQTGGNRVR